MLYSKYQFSDLLAVTVIHLWRRSTDTIALEKPEGDYPSSKRNEIKITSAIFYTWFQIQYLMTRNASGIIHRREAHTTMSKNIVRGVAKSRTLIKIIKK